MHKAHPHHARPRCRCVSTEVSAVSCREISPVSRICCRVCSPPNAVSALIRCSVCCTRLASHIESVRRCRWIVSRRRGGFPVSVSTGRFVSYSRVMVSISCPMIRFRTRSLSSRRSNSSHKARKNRLSRVENSCRIAISRMSRCSRLRTAVVRREGAQAQNNDTVRSNAKICDRIIPDILRTGPNRPGLHPSVRVFRSPRGSWPQQ